MPVDPKVDGLAVGGEALQIVDRPVSPIHFLAFLKERGLKPVAAFLGKRQD